MLMLNSIATYLKSLVRSERGATMVEYGIMVALIAAISILVITNIGTDVSSAFQTVDDGL